MSGVAIIRTLLAGNATLTAQVPAARIQAGTLPQGTALPAISVTEVSGVSDLRDVAQTANTLVRERVQVTVLAATYPAVKSVLELVRDALPKTRGTVAGFACDSITHDSEGPDLSTPELSIFEQSQDFIVRFVR